MKKDGRRRSRLDKLHGLISDFTVNRTVVVSAGLRYQKHKCRKAHLQCILDAYFEFRTSLEHGSVLGKKPERKCLQPHPEIIDRLTVT